MKTKGELLLKLSFLTGVIPFVGGWGIFLTWLVGRYFFAIDFKELEPLGFMWMVMCFFVAIGGLCLLLIYVILNRNNLHKKMLIVLIVILVNIPSVFIVLRWQDVVSDKMFIRIENDTKINKLNINILSSTDKVLLCKTINKGEYHVFNLSFKDEWTKTHEGNLRLILSTHSFDKDYYIQMGHGICRNFTVDSSLNLRIIE